MAYRNYGRALLAAALSLITGIGGHFINRRWDKALLFLALIPGWFLITYVGLILAVNLSGSLDPSGMSLLFSKVWDIGLYGCVVFYVASVLTTVWDARANETTFRPEWTRTGIAGAVIVSITSTVVLIYALSVMVVSYPTASDSGSEAKTVPHTSGFASSFLLYGNFGGSRDDASYTAPPGGDGHLNLRFSYAGAPAVGVGFTVRLDGKYESKKLVTDENGIASLAMPPGTVYLNRLRVTDWKDAPAYSSAMTIRTGHEQKFDLDNYNKFAWYDRKSKGLEVSATEEPDTIAMEFQIVPRIEMLWPLKTTGEATVRHDEGIIRWSPVAGAETYLLEIMSIERHGNSTMSQKVVTRKVDGSSLFPLARLPVVKSDNGKHEYSVRVTAFAGDGSYLTESGEPLSGSTFVLADDMELAEDEYQSEEGGTFSETDYLQLRKDKQRLDVSHGLVDEERYDLATSLLATVSEPSRKGEWHALHGLMLAKQQRCAEAEVSLKKAEEFGDCDCSVKKTRKLCENK